MQFDGPTWLIRHAEVVRALQENGFRCATDATYHKEGGTNWYWTNAPLVEKGEMHVEKDFTLPDGRILRVAGTSLTMKTGDVK